MGMTDAAGRWLVKNNNAIVEWCLICACLIVGLAMVWSGR